MGGQCTRGSDCTYAHDESELQEKPDLTKTSMCVKFTKSGKCDDKNCLFAHYESELRKTSGFVKTKMCDNPSDCKNGADCRYAHSKEELEEHRAKTPRGASRRFKK